MAKTTMIRARTEPELKDEVEKIFHALGLTSSEAINIFYHKVKLEKGLPFEVKIPNNTTLQAMEDVKKKRHLRQFDNVEEMLRELKD